MKAVVTGATGAIGMALLEELEKNEIETLVLYRADSTRSQRIRESRYIKKSICALEELSLYPTDDEKYDMFFHLAWLGTAGDGRNNKELQQKNVAYALQALALANSFGCSVFIGAGSQAEYGRANGALTHMTPTFPENEYGRAKLLASQLCKKRADKFGMRFVWARILSVYGPYDTEGSMVASAINKLLSGERPQFTGGDQIWDYLYSTDAARALYLLGVTKTAKGIYCIGGNSPRRLKEYIYTIRNAVDPNAEIGLGEIAYPRDQIMELYADISRLNADTGFIPTVSFEEGIKKTVLWHRECKEREKHEKDQHNGTLL